MSKTSTFGQSVSANKPPQDTRLDTKKPQAWIHLSWRNTVDQRATIVVSPHGAFTGAHELTIDQAQAVADALAAYKRAGVIPSAPTPDYCPECGYLSAVGHSDWCRGQGRVR